MPTPWSMLVEISNHQFSIEDRERRGRGELWQNPDWFQTKIGVSAGLLTIFTNRSSGGAPVTIEIVSEEPVVDARAWSRIVLAYLACPSGAAVIQERATARGPRPEIALDSGHRVLVCSGDVDSTEADGSVGADHYRLILWPAEPTPPRVIKDSALVVEVRRTPALTLDQCLTMIASTDRHTRFAALSELARHATTASLASLQAAARDGDALDRIVAIGALCVGRPVRIDQLDPFLTDEDVDVRHAILPVLHQAMLDFEFERTNVLDTDIAYRILNQAAADADSSIRHLATRLTTALDGLADLIPAPAASTTGTAIIERLLENHQLEIDGDFVPATAAAAVEDALEDAADASAAVQSVADVLVDLRGVIEVYADDETLARIVRDVIASA